jgi:ankyrin repeat protein
MGASFMEPDYEGNTPLHYAVMYGSSAAANVLLSNSANTNATNRRGETA